MKTKLSHILTVIMAVIFLCNTGVYAATKSIDWLMDTRRGEISAMTENQQMPVPIDRNGNEIIRPLAAFEVIRIDDRPITPGLPNPGFQGKALSTGFQIDNKQDTTTVKVEFPDYTLKEPEDINTLYCYVGETLYFNDCSVTKNNGDKIAAWDWQYWGDLYTSDPNNHIYDYNILGKTELKLTKPGKNDFFLCVKSSTKPHKTSDWAWSVNGSHQSLGENPNYPKGILWYFAQVQVIVQEDMLINYIDKDTGMKLGHEYRRIFQEDKGNPSMGSFSVPSPKTFNGTAYLYDHSELYNSDGSHYASANGMDFTFVDDNGIVVPYRRVDIYMGKAEGLKWDVRYINVNSGEVFDTKEITYESTNATLEYTIKEREGYTYVEHVENLPDGTQNILFDKKGKIRRMNARIDIYFEYGGGDKTDNTVKISYIDITDGSVMKTETVPEDTVYKINPVPHYKYIYCQPVFPDGTLGDKNPDDEFPVGEDDVNAYFTPEDDHGDEVRHEVRYIDINTSSIFKSEKVDHASLYPISPIEGYRFLHYCEVSGGEEGEKQTKQTLFVNTDINAYFTEEDEYTGDKITVKYIDLETDKVLKTERAIVGDEYEIDAVSGYEYVYYKPVYSGRMGAEHSENTFIAQKNEDINAYFMKYGGGFDNTGECSDTIKWTEAETHSGTYRSWSSTQEKYVTRTYTCTHKYTYQAKLTAQNTHLTDKIFKAGYGFSNEVSCKVKVEMVSKSKSSSHCGKAPKNTRTPQAVIHMPTKAVIDTGFIVESVNRGKQNRLLEMELCGSATSFSDMTAKTAKFQNEENPLSVLNKRTVFTPVYLPDGDYSYDIFISGGKVELEDGSEKELCLSLEGRDGGKYTIKGDMYEDDSTNAT